MESNFSKLSSHRPDLNPKAQGRIVRFDCPICRAKQRAWTGDIARHGKCNRENKCGVQFTINDICNIDEKFANFFTPRARVKKDLKKILEPRQIPSSKILDGQSRAWIAKRVPGVLSSDRIKAAVKAGLLWPNAIKDSIAEYNRSRGYTLALPLFRFDDRRATSAQLRYTGSREVQIKSKSLKGYEASGCYFGVGALAVHHAVAESKPIMIVEGIPDYLTGLALGFGYRVLGVAGVSQAKKLVIELREHIKEKYAGHCVEFILALDGDNAGVKATSNCVIEFGKSDNVVVRMLDLRDGEDLNDCFLARGEYETSWNILNAPIVAKVSSSQEERKAKALIIAAEEREAKVRSAGLWEPQLRLDRKQKHYLRQWARKARKEEQGRATWIEAIARSGDWEQLSVAEIQDGWVETGRKRLRAATPWSHDYAQKLWNGAFSNWALDTFQGNYWVAAVPFKDRADCDRVKKLLKKPFQRKDFDYFMGIDTLRRVVVMITKKNEAYSVIRNTFEDDWQKYLQECSAEFVTTIIKELWFSSSYRLWEDAKAQTVDMEDGFYAKAHRRYYGRGELKPPSMADMRELVSVQDMNLRSARALVAGEVEHKASHWVTIRRQDQRVFAVTTYSIDLTEAMQAYRGQKLKRDPQGPGNMYDNAYFDETIQSMCSDLGLEFSSKAKRKIIDIWELGDAPDPVTAYADFEPEAVFQAPERVKEVIQETLPDIWDVGHLYPNQDVFRM